MTAVTPLLLTAEEFLRTPDTGQPSELVRGEIVMMPPPNARHGQVCSRIDHLLRTFAEQHDLGHVLCNDSGVITTRDPDTVRGADIAFYSYSRLPRGKLAPRYPSQPPEVVFEVRSPDDRLPDILTKVAEYLRVGVAAVCVVDPDAETVTVYDAAQQRPATLSGDASLRIPPPLAGFVVPVSRLFE
ncbi:MAG: Uma2 family endonuclease [Planctomycetia bacterium]|nr:Uma2 family endonuclease [Planctomycetia bacterium]